MRDKVAVRRQKAEGGGGCGTVLWVVVAVVGVGLCVDASLVNFFNDGERLVVDGDFNVRGTMRGDSMDDVLRRLEALETVQERVSELENTVREKEEEIMELERRMEQVENITSESLAPVAEMDATFRIQNIPTRGAVDWEYFNADGDHYLTVANHYASRSYNIDSVMYVRAADDYFMEFQRIGTSGAADWEYFNVDGDHYLAVANSQNGDTRNVDSVVYVREADGSFVEFQRIGTSGAVDWEYFNVDGDHYLAVANMGNDETVNIDSVVYVRGEEGSFSEFQRIGTSGANDWEYFNVEGDHFLVVSNSRNDTTYIVDSVVYVRGEDGFFSEFRTIGTSGATDWEYFNIDGDHFLAVANKRVAHDDFDVASVVYVLGDDGFFSEFQRIDEVGADDWEYFNVDGDHFLAVSHQHNGATFDLDSVVYIRGVDGYFTEFQRIATHGALDFKHFTMDGAHFVAIANSHDGRFSGGGSYDVPSRILRRKIMWEF